MLSQTTIPAHVATDQALPSVPAGKTPACEPPQEAVDEPRLHWWYSPENQERFAGGVASFLVHITVILVLTLFINIPLDPPKRAANLVVSIREPVKLVGDTQFELASSLPSGGVPLEMMGVPKEVEVASEVIQWQADVSSVEQPAEPDQAAIEWIENPVESDRNVPTGAMTGGGLEGRSAGLKGGLLRNRGGTRQSEEAVAKGLRWLSVHQRSNGSWSFNHQRGPCGGHCRNPGDFASATASTALALLPFYGAGYTHLQGEYKDVVLRGLVFLGNKMILTDQGGDLQNGSMYGQGLAAIVFCEAYAMTKDEELRPFAQAAVKFIEHAQHSEGGWRYLPGQPGDMTVTGWQLMALKSGQLAGLKINSTALYRAGQFLDQLQSDRGSRYGYKDLEPRPATTAIGLFSRMILGWNQFHPALVQGVHYLDELGPSEDDIYFNYYATLVLNHFDGPSWPSWNERMREQLINDQAKGGHENGSWYYEHEHSQAGGRLYNTCLSIMTLEVYYRYMPLYGRDADAGYEIED